MRRSGQLRLLLVEDEPGLVLTLTDLLTSEGYDVSAALDGEEGLSLASADEFDLVILDVMLPLKDGFSVCRDLRQRGVSTPIIMLTARGQLVEKILGLKLGADDYLTKPFESLELLARVEAVLRRRNSTGAANAADRFRFGSVEVDFPSTEVRRAGKKVDLSAREFKLLEFFIRNAGRTISRNQLQQDVWGYSAPIISRTVDVHVGLLRQKLEEDAKTPRHFLTVRGLGYKFVDQG
jgi:two-component system alkaline phosphatase synthesis response regulator PhoP